MCTYSYKTIHTVSVWYIVTNQAWSLVKRTWQTATPPFNTVLCMFAFRNRSN